MQRWLVWLTALALSCCIAERPAVPKWNVIVLLVDDLGWKDVGAFGSAFYETPNIDRLAADGMRFSQGYSAGPVCSPTRTSILTGKYPARMGTTDAFGFPRQGPLLPASYVDRLPDEELTLAESFKKAGYATAFIGKWHMGSHPSTPENQGFDFSVAADQYGAPPTYFYPYRRPNHPSRPAFERLEGVTGEFLTDRLTDESLKFIDAHRKSPFLLFLSYYAVHMPLMTKPELEAKYSEKKKAMPPVQGPVLLPEGSHMNRQVQDHPVYAGMVQSVDESVGRIMQSLEQRGLGQNTIIVFLSDNGGLSMSGPAPTSNVPLRAGKGWLYEGGIRIPLIIKWPGRLRKASSCDEPVITNDIYPTLLEMAGLPAQPQQHSDGISLVPLLTQQQSLGRRELFWHFPHYSPQGGAPSSAIRQGDLKLIEYFEDNRVELFDLANDLGEQRDLHSERREKADELLRRLREWRSAVGARTPAGPDPTFHPSG